MLRSMIIRGLVSPFPQSDAAAQPLLESDNPADCDAAVEKYLDPLSEKYPDRYAAEVAAARTKVKDRRELRMRIDLICKDIVHAYRRLAEKVVDHGGPALGSDGRHNDN